ncbi:MAG: hypothetical protein GX628_10450 [Clostridiales bacterium]|nr:hypothetical protein [Clostridiales bacterium]
MKIFTTVILLCLIACLSFVSCANTNGNDHLENSGVSVISTVDSKNVASRVDNSIEPSSDDIEIKFANAIVLLQDNGAFGGGSYLFNREYKDETYNIAYLSRICRGEFSILPEGTLDRWVNDVFLKQSEEIQNSLPTMYQAIRDLNIHKEDLIALNESRKQLGSKMIMSDEYINALYMPEIEMKQELVNPLALYYEGEVFTLEKLNDISSEKSVSKVIPVSVMNEYIDRVISYCGENGYITDNEVERFFGVAFNEIQANKDE